MRCPRCLNTDPEFFYHGSRGWYCRKCISFGRAMLEEEKEAVSLSPVREGANEYTLAYPLTKAQEAVSHACADALGNCSVLLQCVCGAGKTELVVESISAMLAKGGKVCFAIPRRQVVLELRERLSAYFPRADVIAVCGGHTSKTDGDLIICTTHQLYRYYQAFDLLILDEPDAFPFRGNAVLHGIAKTAAKGAMIYLTATPDASLLKQVRKQELVCLTLNRRPHGHDLPVPVLFTGPFVVLFLKLLVWLKQRSAPRMVFAPTIREARILHRILSWFLPCRLCTSKTVNRDEVIEAFRKDAHGVIVCTTVLERGVTVANAQIAVFHADHGVFDEAGLIQMAGRAGRTFEYPEGDVLFLLNERSRLCEQCRKEIEEANQCAV